MAKREINSIEVRQHAIFNYHQPLNSYFTNIATFITKQDVPKNLYTAKIDIYMCD